MMIAEGDTLEARKYAAELFSVSTKTIYRIMVAYR